jgi:hypothetical protein
MVREASAQREKQEQSIKARKSELFVEEEVEYGPRKKLRDYIKETPAAPLSKNVKLMLWGSAAPVVFLFVAALLVRRTHFTRPEDLVIPVHQPAPAIASRSGDTLPVVASPKSEGPGAKASSSKPPQDKAKAKAKAKKPKPKPKPKDETAVAQNAEGDSAKSEKPKDGDQGDQIGAEQPKDKGTAKGNTNAKGKSATPEKPRKQAPPILRRKPRIYNPAYPPRTPVGEKKGEPDSEPDSGIP